MNTLISIITPSFNKARFIEQTIQSVLQQTYSNWELIIVDDASTDNTAAILKEYALKDDRLKIELNTLNQGGNQCRNQGIKMAIGEFIVFLDADDILTPDCLNNRLKLAQEKPKFDLWVFAMGAFYNSVGDAPENSYWIPTTGNFLTRFLNHNIPWSICQPLWKTAFIKNLNGFDLSFKRLQDVELHTRALINGAKVNISKNQKPDCYYRIDPTRNAEKIPSQIQVKTQSAIQFYQKFFVQIPKVQQSKLTGTLIESLGTLLFYYRSKNLAKKETRQLGNALISACKLSVHKAILSFYFNLDLILPFHPKGLKWLTRKLCNCT